MGIINLIGQPELRIELDQERMARYGVSVQDANSIIAMAIGGKAATQLYEGEKKFDVRIRYKPEFRQNESDIGKLLIPTLHGNRIPLKEIAHIYMQTGPAFIYREDNARFIAVKFSVRGRDLGSVITEAQAKVAEQISLQQGMTIRWNGEFENQIRATKRLAQIVPIVIIAIFILLYATFGNFTDALLVILNVPFALTGGIFALLLTGINFSISAGVGFIALFGVCIQNGVIIISVFNKNIQNRMPLHEAIREGIEARIRPVLMTAMIASIGLTPAALSTGIGSETQKSLAIVIIGGLISATILTLLIFPLIFEKVHEFLEKRKQREKD